MKVGVLTLPLHSNYGGNLQAYASMLALKQLGHEPVLIDRARNRHPAWKVPLVIGKRVLLRYGKGRKDVKIGAGIFDRKDREALEVHSRRFIQRHIQPQTAMFESSGSLAAGVEGLNLDAIVVGSDQVWRPEYAPQLSDYFLGFLGEDRRVRRISYAASFGRANWAYNATQTAMARSLLARFDAVSVREDTAVGLCEAELGVRAEHVVDPTLLLEREDYCALVQQAESASHELPMPRGVLVYVLDETEEKKARVQFIESELGLGSFRVNSRTEDFSAALHERIAPPIEDWLRGFIDADFVVTDSFHACVFAMIFNKPFLVQGNAARGLGRFESLLRMFGLASRLMRDGQPMSPALIHEQIDWDAVNAKIRDRREHGLDFLRNALR